MRKALETHPDKGGSESAFRELQGAWEVVRATFDQGLVHPTGFAHYFSSAGTKVSHVGSGRPVTFPATCTSMQKLDG